MKHLTPFFAGILGLLLLVSATNAVTYTCDPVDTPADVTTRFGKTGCTQGYTDPHSFNAYNFQSACWLKDFPSTILDDIQKLYPDGYGYPKGLVKDAYITATTDSNLTIIFVGSGGGYVNALGYFKYDWNTGAISDKKNVFPWCNNGGPGLEGSGCLKTGDSVTVPIKKGDTIGFWLGVSVNKPDEQNAGYYSFQDGNRLRNFDGQQHLAWVYLEDKDLTLFGWEDLANLGDQDYNDSIFSFVLDGTADFSDRPTYENGSINTCTPLQSISATSYTEINCQQWGLLETSQVNCLSYLSLPDGWTWAPDDATSKSVITQMASTWSYTGAQCYLLSTGSTTGNGYTSTLSPCTAEQASIKVKANAGNPCYSTSCTNRYVLKGRNLGASGGCVSDGGVCNPSTASSIVSQFPAPGTVAPVTPYTYNVFLKATAGTQLDLTTKVIADVNNKALIDVLIFIDGTALTSDDKSYIAAGISSVYQIFGNTGFQGNTDTTKGIALGFAFYSPTGPNDYNMITPGLVFDYDQLLKQLDYLSPSAIAHPTPYITQAVADLLSGGASINWRPDAYHAVWVISNSKQWAPIDYTGLNNAIVLSGVVPVFMNAQIEPGVPSTSEGYSGPPAGYPDLTKLPTGSSYSCGTNVPWRNCLSYAGNIPIFNRLYRTVTAVAAGANANFLTGLPKNVPVPSDGVLNFNYKVVWPNGLAANPDVAGYKATVNVMGRTNTQVNIFFNHPPVVPDVTASVSAAGRVQLTFYPTDRDSNTLTMVLKSAPTKGKVYRINSDGTTGSEITLASPSLTVGQTSVYYIANDFVEGTDVFNWVVDDGCATDAAKATVNIAYLNHAPEADSFSIHFPEDTPVTADAVRILFQGKYRDQDNIKGGKTQALKLRLVALPASLGKLVDGTTTTTVLTTNTDIAETIRFSLNANSGPGVVTFRYVVNDGTANSAPGTVTVTVDDRPHPPALSVPTVITGKAGTTVTIKAFITDSDAGNTENIQVTAKSLTAHSITGSAGRVVGSGAIAANYPFFSPDISSSSATYTASLTWNVGTTSADETITIRAADSTGLFSDPVTITLKVAESLPPHWVTRPQADASDVLEIQQDTPTGQLAFAATDDDDNQEWKTLVFTVFALPAHGTVKVVHIGSGTDLTLSTVGTTFTYTNANGNVNQNQISAGPPSTGNSEFKVVYTPTSGYFGTDSFSFTVKDARGSSAAERATVNLRVLRKDTAPATQDTSITVYEDSTGTVSIPISSTNGDREVRLQLVSTQLNAKILIGNTQIFAGQTSDLTKTGSITLTVQPGSGVASRPAGTPVGTFTYKAIEPSSNPANLASAVHTCTVYVVHVNHPPTASDLSNTIKKRDKLCLTLPALDVDPEDSGKLTAKIVSFGPTNKGNFYTDDTLTTALTADTPLKDLKFCYQSNVDFSAPGIPLATYNYIVTDAAPSDSRIYQGKIVVNPAGDPPEYAGSLNVTTYQSTPLPINLNTKITTETGHNNVLIKITALPTKGTFSYCDAAAVCTKMTVGSPALPFLLPDITNTFGRVVYVPKDFEWGNNFDQFKFRVEDGETGSGKEWTMNINVIHVNQAPKITPLNFGTTLDANPAGIVMNESSSYTLVWKATDVDTLPSGLKTQLRATFYTASGFNLFSCKFVAGGTFNDSACTFDPATPSASRADFAKQGRKIFDSYEVLSTGCPDFDTLRAAKGVIPANCESHFKMNFAPALEASGSPYISLTLTAIDDNDYPSPSITTLILVKSVNTPPTIFAPALVVAGPGIDNPFITDTAVESATFGSPVKVGDVDDGGNQELLIIQVLEGFNGTLQWPEDVNCYEVPGDLPEWNCLDRINSFNDWLKQLRFQVTSGSEAQLQFSINDMGHSGDYKPSPQLTTLAKSVTVVKISPAGAAPHGNSATLAIAVGVAAGVGLLVLGALGFFLRNAVTPPTDDYFSAATTPLSAAPQSPLYQPGTTEAFSPLYQTQ